MQSLCSEEHETDKCEHVVNEKCNMTMIAHIVMKNIVKIRLCCC